MQLILNIHSNSTKLILSIAFFVSMFLATFIMSPATYALDTESLVGAWLFDEGGGDTINDSSGNGHDGEIVQGEVDWVDGKFGGALEFDGSSMATVQDDAALDLISFTLSAWINVPAISGAWQIIASKENRNPTGRNYGMFCNIDSGVVHYSFTTGAGWKSFNANTVVTDGEWHHVAATYENPDFKMYLDGEVDAQESPDDVMIWDKALSQDEIQEVMKGGLLAVYPEDKLATTWSRIKIAY